MASVSVASPEVFTTRQRVNQLFPNASVADTLEISSPETPYYNCVAWSLGIDNRWVQPLTASGMPVRPWAVWPNSHDRGGKIATYVDMYKAEGFTKAIDGQLQKGVDKIVLFWEKTTGEFTHVARQTEDGRWWSKLGQISDVKHVAPATLGPPNSLSQYGEVWGYMKRKKSKALAPTPLRNVLGL